MGLGLSEIVTVDFCGVESEDVFSGKKGGISKLTKKRGEERERERERESERERERERRGERM